LTLKNELNLFWRGKAMLKHNLLIIIHFLQGKLIISTKQFLSCVLN